MSLFPLSKNKENLEQSKDRNDMRLAQYKDTLKRYKQSMEEYTQRLRAINNHPVDSQITLVQTEIQLSQIKNQSEGILLILEEIKLQNAGWSQEQSEEVLSQGKKSLDLMESLMATIIETNYKLEDMDKRLINNLTAVLSELHKQLLMQICEKHDELSESYLKLQKTVKGNRGFLWMLFILQFIGLGALAFIILYLLDFIYI